MFADDIASARELIEENGELVSFVGKGSDHVCFIPVGGSVAWLATLIGTNVPTSVQIGLLAGDTAIEPNIGDVIVRTDGETLSIAGADRLCPNGETILYTLRLVA